MPAKRIKKKVLISVTNDLVIDRRVFKVSGTLTDLGFDVLLIGIKLRNSLAVNYPFATKRFMILFKKGPLFYAEYNIRLFIYLIFRRADIYLSNDLDTLPANFIVSKLRKRILVFDSHELFTELPELIDRKIVKRIWEGIERMILPKLKYAYTVCESVANVYNKKYGICMKVIRNVPVCKKEKEYQRSDFLDRFTDKKIILYQGFLNKGRGLEHMINAMQYINDAVLIIVGTGMIEENLFESVKDKTLEEKVYFVGKIPHEDLQSITNFADLGISIEENISLNYFFSLPNKLFDYINANVPVLVSRFPETEKIVSKYNIGEFIENHEPKHLAKKINSILSNEEKIIEYKKNLKTAAKDLCWENEAKKLKEIFIDL